MLKSLPPHFVDGEHNPIVLDAAYSLRRNIDLDTTMGAIYKEHGDSTVLLPMSARSAGGGIFQVPPPADNTVVGLSIEPSNNPVCSMADDVDLAQLALDDIVVCPERNEIFAGAAITLDQLNTALTQTLGSGFRVLGADLTSYAYAQVGSTFMTGGMGPQRRYFSDSVTAISLFDGQCNRNLEGEELTAHAGTYGWTGLVHAVRCQYVRLPTNELAFALPVDSSGECIARLIAQLAPWCFLERSNGVLVNWNGNTDIILGIEHITLESMEPMLMNGGGSTNHRHAKRLAQKCLAADCDGLVFVHGLTHGQRDTFLMDLIDSTHDESFTIAGIDLEHTEVFNDPEEMRALRESIPFAARTQAPRGEHVYKSHTDATIRLDPNTIEPDMSALWEANCHYVSALSAYFENCPDILGQVLVYGHMNPWGVDPHNRITMACDDQTQFDQAVGYIEGCTHHFYRELDRLCRDGYARFIGGEKSAGSEREILAAFQTPEAAPTTLADKYFEQRSVIRAAPLQFNWRAMPPYVDR